LLALIGAGSVQITWGSLDTTRDWSGWVLCPCDPGDHLKKGFIFQSNKIIPHIVFVLCHTHNRVFFLQVKNKPHEEDYKSAYILRTANSDANTNKKLIHQNNPLILTVISCFSFFFLCNSVDFSDRVGTH
jgi:hypothetical protein